MERTVAMPSAKDQSLKLMRLLDTGTYHFVEETKTEYLDECVILSHQWVGGETTMQAYDEFLKAASARLQVVVNQNFVQMDDKAAIAQFSAETAHIDQKLRSGIAKILKFCFIARANGYQYAWVDTCCINKKDRRLEDKAINSMWDYYSRCAHCFVYFKNVTIQGLGRDEIGRELQKSGGLLEIDVIVGWTMQEMLAAKDLTLFDSRWQPIGSKRDFIDDIAVASKIDARYLTGNNHRSACTAVKMSWLSKRETKFDEDMAYCMLGLFDVRLDVRYGEGGEQAFLRLQHALLKKRPQDESIFAWIGAPNGLSASGLLAPWPAHFAGCGSISSVPAEDSNDMLIPQVSTDESSIGVQIPAKHYNLNNGADWNNANAANMIDHSLLLHCRQPQPAQDKKKSEQDKKKPEDYIFLQMVRNQQGVWRRVPSKTFALGPLPKSSKGSTTMVVPQSAAFDDFDEVQQAKKKGLFGRMRVGMKAAIDAQTGRG